jgi:hypothetical protein
MRFKNLLATFMTIGIFCLFAIGASAAPKGETPTKYFMEDVNGGPIVQESAFLSCDGFEVILRIQYGGWSTQGPAAKTAGSFTLAFPV